jgi:hypothetical protein
MNRRSRTSPHIIGYKKNTNRKKKKAHNRDNDCEITKPFKGRNFTPIFGRKERQLKHYQILEMCQPGLPSLI